MSNNEENNEKIEITFDDNKDIIYDYIEENKLVKQETYNNFKKCNFLLKIYIFFLFLLIIILIILLLILYL